MGAFIVYIIKSSLLLAMLVSLFMLFMSRETFHKLNRYLLLLIIVASLALPFVNVGVNSPFQGVLYSIENGFTKTDDALPVVDVLLVDEQPVMTTLPSVATFDAVADGIPVRIEEKGSTAPLWQIIVLVIYGLGVALLVVRQVVMYVLLSRLIMRSRKVTAEQYGLDGVRLRLHNGEEKPFSWFGWVVVSDNDMAEGAREILIHEAAHVRAGHSWDIMLADAVIIMQWFNPLAWIMKNTLKDIHEFEADEAVISSGVNAKQYQLLIIKKAVGARLYSIANSFNHSLTKKRITMMCKEKSNKWSRAKALYILPVAAIAACSFSTAENANAEPVGKVNEIVSDGTISGVEKNSKVTSLKLPAGKEWMYAHLCYMDGSAGNNESVCIAYIRGAEGENVGYFRGTTDEFDNAREGYAPGYFVVPLRNVKLDKNVMTFSIYADDATILQNPVKCSECGIVNAVNNGELWRNDASYFKSKKADFKLILGPRSVLQNLTNPYVGGERVLGGVEIDYVYDNTSDELADDNPDKIHQVVEVQPEFPGGMKEMMKYIQSNLKYPEAAKAAGAEGKAFVQFVVKADGSISDVQIMRSTGNESLDAEALRVVKAMPKWRPAMNKGKAVNVKFVLPVVFKLQKEAPVIELEGGGAAVNKEHNAAFVVDGELYEGDIADINSQEIESMTVVKKERLSAEELEKYNAGDRDGVIFITMKKSQKAEAVESNQNPAPEKMPEYPGGQQELMKYLSTKTKYPKEARDAEVMGKVFVRFVVQKDGTIAEASVLKGEYSKYVYSAEAISLKNHIAQKEEELEKFVADGVSDNIIKRRAMELAELKVQAHSSIEKNSGRTEVKVDASDVAVKALEAEALRVIGSMPKWIPGMQDGKPVFTQFVMPIMFRLQ